MATELQSYLAYLPHDSSFQAALLEELKRALPDGSIPDANLADYSSLVEI